MSKTSIALLASAEIRPLPDCQDYVWSRLADFPGWVEYLPGLHAQRLIYADPPGRGTVLMQQWGRNEETWQVQYWHPGQRLELILQESTLSIGVRFDLDAGSDTEHTLLKLEAEIHCTGVLALLAPLYAYLLRRRVRSRFLPLMHSIQQAR